MTHQEKINQKIDGANYSKLSINEKINLKAFVSQFHNSRPAMRIRKSNPYIYTGDFSRLPIKTGKGYSI